MLNQVKRFDANGALIEIIPPEKLFLIGDDNFGGDKPQPPKKQPIKITCEFCGGPAKVFLASRTTCKRSLCERKKREQRKANKLKIKGKGNV